jgi:O-antigen/teichoic acid export membrane protein
MLVAWSIVAILYAFFVMFYAGRKINYTFFEQLKDILPYFILASIMAIGVYFLPHFITHYLILFFCQLALGSLFYLISTYLLGSKIFREAIAMVKSKKLIRVFI